jgi:N6-adenosine-specific RNA methylase IME4
LLKNLYPPLPNKKYDIIYADPPWDYGGKMQYDRSCIKSKNIDFKKNIFISSACFKYPTLKLSELKTLDIQSICEDNCLLFMWTTGPQLSIAIELGVAWGFEYKTVAFVWDKQMHNPGRYTLSQTEFCLVFKKGKIPIPRGARNIKQLVSIKRSEHSTKPDDVIKGISLMFPTQNKIELFARRSFDCWDSWGIDILEKK